MLKFIILITLYSSTANAFEVQELHTKFTPTNCLELNDNQVRRVLPVPKWLKFNINKHSAKVNIHIKLP